MASAAVSPALPRAVAAATADSKRSRSSSSVSTVSVYPTRSDARRAARSLWLERRSETNRCTELRADLGGSSHRAPTIRSADTRWFRLRSSSARTARCLAPPTLISSPSRRTPTGFSSWNSNTLPPENGSGAHGAHGVHDGNPVSTVTIPVLLRYATSGVESRSAGSADPAICPVLSNTTVNGERSRYGSL